MSTTPTCECTICGTENVCGNQQGGTIFWSCKTCGKHTNQVMTNWVSQVGRKGPAVELVEGDVPQGGETTIEEIEG